jgi:L-lactate dehydrogenase complex protein LldG
MSSRDAILQSIRGALGRDLGTRQAPLSAPTLRIPLTDRNLYLDLFVRNFENLGGKAVRAGNRGAVVRALLEMLNGKHVVASNATFLKSCGISELPGVQTGFVDRQALREACATADIGITSADYALAATGTLVLLSSAEEARLVSLLPPVHIAVIPRSRILANLDELLGVLPLPAQRTSAMVLITGPSRTADIEQILVRGVHGPGEICTVIVEDE